MNIGEERIRTSIALGLLSAADKHTKSFDQLPASELREAVRDACRESFKAGGIWVLEEWRKRHEGVVRGVITR
jgi:hypothetical protein